MLRRTLISALVAALLAGGAAEAGVTQDVIVAELRDQGFSRIEIGRTLLGRVRIVATGNGMRREIVFNPGTGVILRDFWQDLNGGGSSGGSILSAGSSGSGGESSGGSDDSDDGDDNSGSGSGSDDDDDDDNSGSGSSGSGDDGESDDSDDSDDDD